MSTLAVNSITSQTGSTITLASGKKIIGTDGGSIAAPGNIIQVVDTSWNTQTVVTATSYTAITGASLAITPKFSTSKILVLVNLSIRINDSNTSYVNGAFQTLRESTNISGSVPTDNTGSFEVGQYVGSSSAIELNMRYSNNVVDSPSTTNATTYSIKTKAYGSTGGAITVNCSNANGSGTSSLVLMEIAQ